MRPHGLLGTKDGRQDSDAWMREHRRDAGKVLQIIKEPQTGADVMEISQACLAKGHNPAYG